jgi:hypothetical protein
VRPEVKRILKLVEEGKLSADDAAELIEAFDDGPSTPPPYEPTTSSAEEAPKESADGPKAPFQQLIDAIERLGKEVSTSVDWAEVARQARQGAQKGLDAVKAGVEQVSKGRFDIGWISGSESKEIELPLSIPEGKTLKIENPCGDVRVIGGKEKGSVIARARFRGSSLDDAKIKADTYMLMIEEGENAVTIRQPDMSGLDVELIVEVPSYAPIDIRTGSGDTSVTDCKNGVRVQGKSGDVSLKGVEGPLEISTASGDVSIEDAVTSSLSVDGKSGDISLNRVH